MKTQLNQIPAFDPIEVKITLETPEELKNFLILTSNICFSSFYNDDYCSKIYIDDNKQVESSPKELRKFGENLISDIQWNTLKEIYNMFKP